MPYAAISPIPMSQFASLSLLTKSLDTTTTKNGSSSSSSSSSSTPSPMIIAVSPTCSCTSHGAIMAIQEVHDHMKGMLFFATADIGGGGGGNSNTDNTTTATSTTKTNQNMDYTLQLLRDDASWAVVRTSTVQIYRPVSTNGMAIHYRYFPTTSSNDTSSSTATTTTTDRILQSLILSSSSSSSSSSNATTNKKIDPSSSSSLSNNIYGVILCVAMTGPSTIFTASSLSYTLSQRMNDCIIHLTTQQQQQQQQQAQSKMMMMISTKQLLTSYLLLDDECRINNSTIPQSTDYIQLPDHNGKGSRISTASTMMSSPLGRMTPIAEFGLKAARRASTGIVRGVMNVGGVSNNTFTTNSAINTQSQQQPQPHIETGFPLFIRSNSATAARTMIDRLTILSVTEQNTFLRKYEQTGQERKANFDLTGGGMNNKGRFRRRRTADTARDADFDHFDYKGPTTTTTATTTNEIARPQKVGPTIGSAITTTMNSPIQPPPTTTGKLLQFKSSAKDTKRGPGSRRPTTTSTPTTTQSSAGSTTTNGDVMSLQKQPNGSRLSDRFESLTKNKRTSTTTNNINNTKTDNDDITYDSRSQQSSGGGGGGSNRNLNDHGSVISNRTSSSQNPLGKLQINIALNEDLSCSYKLSQLSSCSVDGIVQVQVKTTIPTTKFNGGIPFILLLKDPMAHIESLNENPKYATKVTNTSDDHNNNNSNNHSFDNDSFNVIVPEQEKYFSLLKYRCRNDLRPVPIRVQAKVKADGTYCRVALQISSNPNNESKLTDLTIAMGVPTDQVHGESLVTQPVGGVYDPTKSSVIWCVSELGCGEKFQLQARFEIKVNNDKTATSKHINSDATTSSSTNNDLNFPVLVRCQCLHVQLSGVGFDVQNYQTTNNNNSNHRQQQQNQFPSNTDIVMKVASRFRLSHREKSS